MDNSILLSIEKTFADMLPKGWVGKYAAFMGNANGTVKANKYNDVYVIKHDRSVEVVRNTRVPNQAKLAVIVGFDDQNPTLLQVLREVNAYQKPPYSPIAEHADPNHTRWGRDPVFVSLQQVVDLLPYPESFTGMTVQLRGGNYYLNGDHVLDNQIVDFSAEIPASGACWVLAEVNDTKVITLRAGDTVASRELLKPENIPASVVDKLRLFAVKCYYGQTRIVQNKTIQDIYICHSAAGAASAGAADSVAWDDITGKPSVFPPDTDITDLIYMRKWVKVVDPSNNDDVSLGYEILDHWINTTTGDIFTCADNTDGAAVWTPNGSGAGGASGGLSGFCVDGTLAVVDEATSPVLITADTTISQWKMYLRTLGASGSTILDVILKRTGEADVSIFDDGVTDNRPEIQWNDTDHLLDADPLIVDFLAGDVLELNIDQVADGASDIVLLPVGVASLSSLEATDGTTSVLHVNKLTFASSKVEDNGSNEAIVTPYVVQIVQAQDGDVATGTTTIPFDDTIPQNTEGTEFISLSITPTDAANILLVDVSLFLSPSAGDWIVMALFQDSTADALAATLVYINDATAGDIFNLHYKMTAGTTSTTTFKVRAGKNGAGTLTLNGQSGSRLLGGVLTSSIKITETLP